MEQDETQLLKQLTQGDKRALQQLFDRHYVPLCRTALRLVHRAEIAEEIVQDVFGYLWEKRRICCCSMGCHFTTLRTYLVSFRCSMPMPLITSTFTKAASRPATAGD